ncbi:hypothetical protein K491DRAFT_720831 [Lophiostoma macrostomum CBS 122681]|uniref:Uncharacterized protein n=1 Tax=Lophiostoma macrostomum CBS 122681 TaxID=1314788 RepID=A0A6A6STG6_9PLEO|nr:hypothetical protein K491DRAFT_720831 [Lophiostoma macrostomum CBS 122681]
MAAKRARTLPFKSLQDESSRQKAANLVDMIKTYWGCDDNLNGIAKRIEDSNGDEVLRTLEALLRYASDSAREFEVAEVYLVHGTLGKRLNALEFRNAHRRLREYRAESTTSSLDPEQSNLQEEVNLATGIETGSPVAGPSRWNEDVTGAESPTYHPTSQSPKPGDEDHPSYHTSQVPEYNPQSPDLRGLLDSPPREVRPTVEQPPPDLPPTASRPVIEQPLPENPSTTSRLPDRVYRRRRFRNHTKQTLNDAIYDKALEHDSEDEYIDPHLLRRKRLRAKAQLQLELEAAEQRAQGRAQEAIGYDMTALSKDLKRKINCLDFDFEDGDEQT